jgi:hypothetical protein
MDEQTLSTRQRVFMMDAESPEFVARQIRMRDTALACVDGFTQAGKSSFARKLALSLGWRHINLDHMSSGAKVESDHYVDCLDLEKLAGAIETSAGAVVEGVCVRDVVSRVRSTDDAVNTYIARVSRPGIGHLIWHDGVELERPEFESRDTEPWLTRDIIAYHRRVRPQAIADFILIRVED